MKRSPEIEELYELIRKSLRRALEVDFPPNTLTDDLHMRREIERAVRMGYTAALQDVMDAVSGNESALEMPLARPRRLRFELNGDAVRPRRQINAREFIEDLRSGFSDEQLRKKYVLSPRGLESAYRKLIDAGLIDPTEILTAEFTSKLPTSLVNLRLTSRDRLDFALPVFDESRPENMGTVRDIAEQGIGVLGLDTDTGELKRLIIPADEIFPVKSFAFSAKCRWVERDRNMEECASGFEIVEIPDEDAAQLRRLIDLLSHRQPIRH